MAIDLIPPVIHQLYEIHEWKHACAILAVDFPEEFKDIIEVLHGFRLKKSWIKEGGGRKSKIAQSLDENFYKRGWAEKVFNTEVVVDGVVMNSPTHGVDCFKNRIALEIEWNNKDPFYDRDLNNFRLLFDLRAISVGVIITRCDHLQAIFNRLDKKDSYGNSTTHMSKLLPRVIGGSGGGCPLLVFGIKDTLYVDDMPWDAEFTPRTFKTLI